MLCKAGALNNYIGGVKFSCGLSSSVRLTAVELHGLPRFSIPPDEDCIDLALLAMTKWMNCT